MKVTAVCMGREVGNYVVTVVFNSSVIMEVEEDPDNRSIIANRQVGENGRVTIIQGELPIQATDYFVKPYVSNDETVEFNALNTELNEIESKIGRIVEAVHAISVQEEQQRLQDELRELESQRNSVKDSMRKFIQRIIG